MIVLLVFVFFKKGAHILNIKETPLCMQSVMYIIIFPKNSNSIFICTMKTVTRLRPKSYSLTLKTSIHVQMLISYVSLVLFTFLSTTTWYVCVYCVPYFSCETLGRLCNMIVEKTTSERKTTIASTWTFLAHWLTTDVLLSFFCLCHFMKHLSAFVVTSQPRYNKRLVASSVCCFVKMSRSSTKISSSMLSASLQPTSA